MTGNTGETTGLLPTFENLSRTRDSVSTLLSSAMVSRYPAQDSSIQLGCDIGGVTWQFTLGSSTETLKPDRIQYIAHRQRSLSGFANKDHVEVASGSAGPRRSRSQVGVPMRLGVGVS